MIIKTIKYRGWEIELYVDIPNAYYRVWVDDKHFEFYDESEAMDFIDEMINC